MHWGIPVRHPLVRHLGIIAVKMGSYVTASAHIFGFHYVHELVESRLYEHATVNLKKKKTCLPWAP